MLVPRLPAALKGFCQLDGQFQGCLGQGEIGGGVGTGTDTREVKPHKRLWFFSFTKTFHWCLEFISTSQFRKHKLAKGMSVCLAGSTPYSLGQTRTPFLITVEENQRVCVHISFDPLLWGLFGLLEAQCPPSCSLCPPTV